MKVSETKPSDLISIKNLLGVREFYLITEKQDVPFKVRAYKGMSGRFFYLDLNQKCKLVTKDVVCKN
tara:strand:+ start:297 stop:497 length:201 start_codon:yes stop_codon:yes gene_type:complete